MDSPDQPSMFTFRAGRVTIDDGAITLNIDFLDAIRRHYQYHKVTVATFCVLALFIAIITPISIVFDPGYVILSREDGLTYFAIFFVPAILLIVQFRRRTDLTFENSIPLERVEYVHIRPPGRFRSSCISIVYDDASNVRQIITNFRGFGETQQHEQAKRVFKAHNIEVREG